MEHLFHEVRSLDEVLYVGTTSSVMTGPSSIPRREISLSGVLGSNSLSSPTADERMPLGEGMESDGRTEAEQELTDVAPESLTAAKRDKEDTPETLAERILTPEKGILEGNNKQVTPKSGTKRTKTYKQVRVTRKVIGSMNEGKGAAGIGIAIGMTSKGDIFLTGMAPMGPAEQSNELIKGDQLVRGYDAQDAQ